MTGIFHVSLCDVCMTGIFHIYIAHRKFAFPLSLAHAHMIYIHLHIQAGLTPTRPTTTTRVVGLLPRKEALADVVELGRLWSGTTLGLHTEARGWARTHGARTDKQKEKKQKQRQPGLADPGRCDSAFEPVTYIHTCMYP